MCAVRSLVDYLLLIGARWLIFAVLLLPGTLCSISVRAQDPAAEVQVSLLNQEIPSLTCEGCFGYAPYSFYTPGIHDDFSYKLMRKVKWGFLKLYRDPACTQRLRYRDLKNMLVSLKYLVRCRYHRKQKLPKGMENAPDYRLDLFRRESWQKGPTPKDLERELLGYGIRIFDYGREDHPGVVGYIRTRDIRKLPFDELNVYRGIEGLEQDENAYILESQLFNFRLPREDRNLVDSLLPALRLNTRQKLAARPARKVETKSEVWLQVPFYLEADNFLPEYNKQKLVPTYGNTEVLVEVIPRIFQAVLTEEVPLYLFDAWEKIPADQVYPIIQEHPETAFEVSAETAKYHDFSYGVSALVLGGKFVRDQEQDTVRYLPESLGLVWTDPFGNFREQNLGRIRFSDLKQLNLRPAGQPLGEYLASLNFHYYPYQINSAFPTSLYQTEWVNLHLRLGRWEELIPVLELQEQSDEELLPEILRLRGQLNQRIGWGGE